MKQYQALDVLLLKAGSGTKRNTSQPLLPELVPRIESQGGQFSCNVLLQPGNDKLEHLLFCFLVSLLQCSKFKVWTEFLAIFTKSEIEYGIHTSIYILVFFFFFFFFFFPGGSALEHSLKA